MSFFAQQSLISRMQKLLNNVSRSGVCFGLSGMRVQAILAQDTVLFDKRLKLITELPRDTFKNEIEALQDKVTAIVQQTKADIGSYRELTEDERENLLEIQENQDALKAIIRIIDEQKLTEEEADSRVNKFLFAAFVQQKIDEKKQALSENEQLMLDISAFLQGVQLFQSAYDYYQHLFEEGAAPIHADFMATLPVTLSKKLEADGGIIKLCSISGAYNIQELQAYFKTLNQSIVQSDMKKPVAFMLTSLHHAITIGYDPVTSEWSLTNANKLPTVYTSSMEILAKKVLSSLSENANAVFTTDVYCNAADENACEAVLSAWESSKEWQEMHAGSFQKNQITDKCGINRSTLLACAAAAGNAALVEELLHDETDPNQRFRTTVTPLYMAVQNGYVDIVKKLLDANANPDDGSENYDPPLLTAVGKSQLQITKMLLEKGANPNIRIESNGATALFLAALTNNLVIARELLEKGAIPEIATRTGDTALFRAVENNAMDMVTLLLQYSSEVDILYYHSESLFINLAKKHNKVAEMEQLLARKKIEQSASPPLDTYLYFMNHHVDLPLVGITPKEWALVLGFNDIATAIEVKEQEIRATPSP